MKIKIGQEEINLDPEILKFTEATLNEYLQKEAAIYSYYSAKWIDSQYINSTYDDKLEELYSQKFKLYKDQDVSDKKAEAMAKADPEVVEAKEKVRISKRTMEHLRLFLRSFDKNHENALNLGYNIRKEIGVYNQNQVKLEQIMN